MRHHPAKTLAFAVAGCTALWTVQAAARDSAGQPSLEALQQQIQQLQQQVQDMKAAQDKQQQQLQQAAPTSAAKTGALAQTVEEAGEEQSSGPKKSLTIGGGAAAEYQVRDHDGAPNQTDGGQLIFDYFSLNAAGQYGDLTYAAEERFSSTNFADSNFLHYAWAAYDFDDHNQLKGGFFQVPFGIVNGLSYQTFWGNITYFAGFTDNQAAGLGYKYENAGWRLDVDAFKNDDLTQRSLYGSNPFQGYQQINGGNVRLGYTFGKGEDNSLDLSAAVRGGQLKVGGGFDRQTTPKMLAVLDANGNPVLDANGQVLQAPYAIDGVQQFNTASDNDTDYGTRWAATAAADAKLGLWTVQGQFVDYRYNIPSGVRYGSGTLPTDTIQVENYGFGYTMPASGQIYSFNLARDFPVKNMGPIDKFEIYNNYSYLHSGEGDYDNLGNRIGDVQFNALGGEMVAGPVYVWADMLMGKNAAMTFTGPNDGDWHPRFNLTAAIYFDGDVIN